MGVFAASLLAAGAAMLVFNGISTAATVRDANFVRSAAKAGYRIEQGRGFASTWVIARCVRMNEAGPLPCDALPRPASSVDVEMIPPLASY